MDSEDFIVHHFAFIEEDDSIADIRHHPETVGYNHHGAGTLDHVQYFLL